MDAQRTTSDHKKKQTLAEFGTGHRLAGLLALAVVALFSTVQWMQLGHEQTGEAAQSERRAAPATTLPDSGHELTRARDGATAVNGTARRSARS